ncbi:heme biosynthesis HemY N-terminal domain-containing protein, partial [Acinetobacter baumannii]
MIRVILFLLLIALGAAGAAWVAEQTGDFVLTWGTLRIKTTFPVFVLMLGIAIAAAVMLWSVLRGLLSMPGHIRRGRRER